jgi:nitroreductase
VGEDVRVTSIPKAFDDVLNDRWSCRAFLPEAVPTETLTEIFALAQRTPSWCNTQPWRVHLVTGEATGRFASSLGEHLATSPMTSDLPMPTEYVGTAKERRRESGYALYSSLGIARDDMAARGAQMLKNFEFFGAPHVAIITTDAHLGVYGAVDCGGYVATLLNAATSRGVASVAQAAIAMYSDHVRAFLDLPADRQVLCAVSLGYADADHPANTFRTSRAGLDDTLVVVD